MDSTTTRDGRTLAHRRVGSGPLVVAHPGGPGFSGSALRDLAGLGSHFELLLLDPRGTGGSDPSPDGTYDLDGYVDDLADVVADVGRPHAVVGHSHGGVVALTYAAHHGDDLDRLVVLGTPTHLDDERIEMLGGGGTTIQVDGADGRRRLVHLGAVRAANPGAAGPELAAWGEPGSPYEPALDDEEVAAAPLIYFNEKVIRAFDLRPVIADVGVPALVVCGREDAAAPPTVSWELAQQLPRGDLAVIEGSGHVPYVENPPAFRSAALQHLAL